MTESLDHFKACRICYEPKNVEVLCKCNGTMKYVHKECIKQWIKVSKRQHCELCGSEWINIVDNKPETEDEPETKEEFNKWHIIRVIFIAYAILCLICILYASLVRYGYGK